MIMTMMRVQITFSKKNEMRYTGHLDLQRALERLIRRASLPLAYSQGYRPKARINLADPLPLGYVSSCEIAEFWLDEHLPIEKIESTLQSSLPPGIQIHSVLEIEPDRSKLQTLVQSSDYRVFIHDEVPDLPEKVRTLLNEESIPCERKRKKMNLRPMIESLEVKGEGLNESKSLVMRLSTREGATARPGDVLPQLGISTFNCRIERIRINFLSG